MISKHLETLFKALNTHAALSNNSWSEAKTLFKLLHFEKNSHIIEMEEIVKDLYFITSGMARYYYLSENGKEFNKTFQTVGNVLTSVSSLVEKKPSPFFIQALEPTTCLVITYDDLLQLVKKFPDWNQLYISLLEKVLIRKESREADFLLLNASQRYKKFLCEYSQVVDKIPNYHIASYLGITEVRLSNIRKNLKLN